MIKLDPAIKARWLEALRSGRYRQGSRGLNWDDREFCCLGVLCETEIGRHENFKKEEKSERPDYVSWSSLVDGSITSEAYKLPAFLTRLTGLSPLGELNEPVKFKGETHMYLAKLNDKGASFEFIAEVIEEQF